jgi:hypothetical protein
VRVNLDVLNAQLQLFNTQRDLSRARYDERRRRACDCVRPARSPRATLNSAYALLVSKARATSCLARRGATLCRQVFVVTRRPG